MLALLEPFDDAALDPSTEAGAHLVLETIKLAQADREAWFGDVPDAVAPGFLDDLLDPDYLAGRRALITDEASPDIRPGRRRGPRAARWRSWPWPAPHPGSRRARRSASRP